MRTRLGIAVALATMIAVLVTAAAAFAVGVTNSTATTNQGWPITFNARSDLKGSLTYQPDGHTFQCKGYNRYIATTTDHHTVPKSIANSTDCFQGELRYFIHVEAIDGGPSGDELCITVKRWPGRLNPVLIKDCGPIQSGNVRIRTDAKTGAVAAQATR
jgi:hypothetical protein